MDELGKHFYDFGQFRVDPSERLLLRGYEVVPLTPKAFEMLLVLVESSGHALTKEELLQRVWPDTIVEEANLSHNIYKLREALGEGRNGEKYIETLPRRGYRFVAKVTELIDQGADLIVEEHSRAHVVVEDDDTPQSAIETHVADVRTLLRRIETDGFLKTRRALAMAALLLLIGVAIAAIYFWRTRESRAGPSTVPLRSIAVLPFKALAASLRGEGKNRSTPQCCV